MLSKVMQLLMVWETSPVPFVNQTPSETLPCANGAACQEGPIVPLQSEASLGQSGEAGVGEG